MEIEKKFTQSQTFDILDYLMSLDNLNLQIPKICKDKKSFKYESYNLLMIDLIKHIVKFPNSESINTYYRNVICSKSLTDYFPYLDNFQKEILSSYKHLIEDNLNIKNQIKNKWCEIFDILELENYLVGKLFEIEKEIKNNNCEKDLSEENKELCLELIKAKDLLKRLYKEFRQVFIDVDLKTNNRRKQLIFYLPILTIPNLNFMRLFIFPTYTFKHKYLLKIFKNSGFIRDINKKYLVLSFDINGAGVRSFLYYTYIYNFENFKSFLNSILVNIKNGINEVLDLDNLKTYIESEIIFTTKQDIYKLLYNSFIELLKTLTKETKDLSPTEHQNLLYEFKKYYDIKVDTKRAKFKRDINSLINGGQSKDKYQIIGLLETLEEKLLNLNNNKNKSQNSNLYKLIFTKLLKNKKRNLKDIITLTLLPLLYNHNRKIVLHNNKSINHFITQFQIWFTLKEVYINKFLKNVNVFKEPIDDLDKYHKNIFVLDYNFDGFLLVIKKDILKIETEENFKETFGELLKFEF